MTALAISSPPPGAVHEGPTDTRALSAVALGVVLAAQLVVVLDFSIVNVALATLSTDLGISADSAQWVVTSYALTFGGLVVLGGRAADLFGRRRVLIAGLVTFAIASSAGGVAANLTVLVVSRSVQGAAAALVAPAALSILTTSFPAGVGRNRVLGYYGIMASVGFVAGLAVGGLLVDTVGWRGVFFVNVPTCFGMALVAAKRLPSTRTPLRAPHLDVPGALLVTAAAAALVLAPSLGASRGWTSIEFVLSFLASMALLGAFVLREQRARQPLVPLGIFRFRTLVVGDAVSGLLGACNAAEVLVISLYCQQVLGYSALVAGLVAIPQGVGGMLRGVVGARLIDRVGIKRFLVANCVLSAVTFGVLFRFSATSTYPGLGFVLLVLGFATTSVVFGATVAGSSGVPDSEQGLSGALLNATRQIGAAVGVAALLSITGTGSGGTTSLARGFRAALAFGTVLTLVAALVSLAVERGDRARRR